MENATIEQPTEKKPEKSALQIALGMSVFTGIIFILYTILTYFTKLYDNSWLNFVIEMIIFFVAGDPMHKKLQG